MSVQQDDYITISEDFYSLQMEGITTGKPAYFIRLKDCNLSCGVSKNRLKEVKMLGENNTVSGSITSDIPTASFVCDTIPVWLFGHKKPFNYLTDKWKSQQMSDDRSLYDWISDRQVHLIWTGGEPTLPKHQKCITRFLKQEEQVGFTPYNEIETNGTIVITDDLMDRIDQINCSAKLSNSGMNKTDRINPESIKQIRDHWNSWFKFVISTEDDIKEFITDYLEPFDIPMVQVVCMPGLDSRENFHERTHFVAEMAKKYGFTGLTRLHISAWGQTVGV